MDYTIDYAVYCERGNVRGKNQDNFWCAGNYLESENNGLTAPIINSISATSNPAFAVFDGMGGEKYGEIAAYLACKTFNDLYSGALKSDMKEFLSEVCAKMNGKICSYVKTNCTGHIGTTAAILAFDKNAAYICNIGDSKIFQYRSGRLTQLSKDHIINIPGGKKPPLSQHLGIPITEFAIEPFFAIEEYAQGDRYLICSDGLTDMVAGDEISKLLLSKKSARECACALTDSALSNGGVDNITVIVCDLC